MNFRTLFGAASLLIGLIASAAQGLSAQGDTETTAAIMESVLRYVYDRGTYTSSRDTTKSAIKVDPRMFVTAGIVPRVESGRTLADAVAARLRSVPGISVVSAERATECGPWAPASCMDNGRSIVLSFATPVVTGDSGFVEVRAKVSVAVSAADSAAYSKNALSLRRASAGSDRVFVKRIDAKWVVQRIVGLTRT